MIIEYSYPTLSNCPENSQVSLQLSDSIYQFQLIHEYLYLYIILTSQEKFRFFDDQWFQFWLSETKLFSEDKDILLNFWHFESNQLWERKIKTQMVYVLVLNGWIVPQNLVDKVFLGSAYKVDLGTVLSMYTFMPLPSWWCIYMQWT